MRTLYLYTKQDCGGCQEAKDILNKFSIPYSEINIDEDQSVARWLRLQGINYVPVLFVEGKLLVPGGIKSLRTMRRHEILERLL